MSNFVTALKKYDDLFTAKGVDKQSVADAESALSLKFAKEYIEYLEECGVASADGHEFTGLIDSKRLNVVDVTKAAKLKDGGIPQDFYVVEELQIDGIVIWQSESGKVYMTAGDGLPEMINDSLAEYIVQGERRRVISPK